MTATRNVYTAPTPLITRGLPAQFLPPVFSRQNRKVLHPMSECRGKRRLLPKRDFIPQEGRKQERKDRKHVGMKERRHSGREKREEWLGSKGRLNS